jgi:hypothetical protein
MKKSVSNPDKHLQHQVDVVLTPDLNHYGKLVCSDCGGTWIKWLGKSETEALLGPQITKQQKIKSAHWSSTNIKERQHYRSFQPKYQQLVRKPTQLIQDRLALFGHSRYNGNSIYSIPVAYLQELLDNNTITNPQDRQQIEIAIHERQQIGA